MLITAVVEQGERWRNDFMRRFRRTDLQQPSDVPFASERRKVGNLLAAAHARAKERARLLNEQRIAEAAKRRAEDEASRTRYLDQLGRGQPEIWKQVATHIQMRQPKDYDKAVSLLADLHDLAVRRSQSDGGAKAAILNNTGIELEKKGDLTGALDHYDQAAKTDVTNVVFQRNAALLLCKMGRPQEAIRRLRDILSLDSDDAQTLQILAVANELAAGDLAKETTLPAAQASH